MFAIEDIKETYQGQQERNTDTYKRCRIPQQRLPICRMLKKCRASYSYFDVRVREMLSKRRQRRMSFRHVMTLRIPLYIPGWCERAFRLAWYDDRYVLFLTRSGCRIHLPLWDDW